MSIPQFLYGTAWKEDQTQTLTEMALKQGFRGIDTANQRRHYHEAAVGQAIRRSLESGLVGRDDLFVQTKFTFRQGQDHRLPYDPNAPIAAQVEQSLSSSIEHLGIEVIDSYLLHGPTQRTGLAREDWAAWQAMEQIYDSGRVRMLGVSNVQLDQLQALCREARIRPCFVQNRCYAVTGWDGEVRAFCAANALIYQGFSLLTANADAIHGSSVAAIAKRHQRTVPQIIFRFAQQMDMLPLTGTSSRRHMQQDLDILNFSLDQDEVKQIERVALLP